MDGSYPNLEIDVSFSTWLAREFTDLSETDINSALHRIVGALRDGRVDDMLEHLKVFFSKVPNTITLRHEKYYRTVFFTVFKLIGAVIEAETSTNIGRIDAVIKTAKNIFVFEFKLDGTAQDAMRQIRDKKYAQLYKDDPRDIILVAVAFDPCPRDLGEWLTDMDGR